jgi:hypothetical protein
MQHNTHATHSTRSEIRVPREQRTIRPPRHDSAPPEGASLSELSESLVVSPDDVSLEIEDLASHFLFEATESDMKSSAPAPAVVVHSQAEDSALREAFFEDDTNRHEQLREFERIWKHILSRELVVTEL